MRRTWGPEFSRALEVQWSTQSRWRTRGRILGQLPLRYSALGRRHFSLPIPRKHRRQWLLKLFCLLLRGWPLGRYLEPLELATPQRGKVLHFSITGIWQTNHTLRAACGQDHLQQQTEGLPAL